MPPSLSKIGNDLIILPKYSHGLKLFMFNRRNAAEEEASDRFSLTPKAVNVSGSKHTKPQNAFTMLL